MQRTVGRRTFQKAINVQFRAIKIDLNGPKSSRNADLLWKGRLFNGSVKWQYKRIE